MPYTLDELEGILGEPDRKLKTVSSTRVDDHAFAHRQELLTNVTRK
jgi:hypothetical protein